MIAGPGPVRLPGRIRFPAVRFLQVAGIKGIMRHPAKYRIPIAWLIFLAVLHCSRPTCAKSLSKAAADSLIRHKTFIFKAQWAIAYTGSRRQLTPPYELFVTSDSVDCYLPFLGRAFTVPTPEELRFMSIHFISKKFSYAAHHRKRQGWDVAIAPADVRDVRELCFSISRNGWATLTIRSAGRDAVSYEGTIAPVSK